jgi:hypothetical protein
MIVSIIYYVLLLIHLFPLLYILMMRFPEFKVYGMSNNAGKVVFSLSLMIFLHILYQLLFGQIFSFGVLFLVVIEVAILYSIGKFIKSEVDPSAPLYGIDMTGKTVLITGLSFFPTFFYRKRRQFWDWLFHCYSPCQTWRHCNHRI